MPVTNAKLISIYPRWCGARQTQFALTGKGSCLPAQLQPWESSRLCVGARAITCKKLHLLSLCQEGHTGWELPHRPQAGLSPSSTGFDVGPAKDVLETDSAQKTRLPQGQHPASGCSCCPGFLPPRLPFLRSGSLPLALPSSEMVNNSLPSFMSLP